MIERLKAKVKLLEEPEIIKVTLVRKPRNLTEWTEDFYVRQTDEVSTLLKKVEE